jgi:hypothetical protein
VKFEVGLFIFVHEEIDVQQKVTFFMGDGPSFSQYRSFKYPSFPKKSKPTLTLQKNGGKFDWIF